MRPFPNLPPDPKLNPEGRTGLDGSGGVREPRRPKPKLPAGGAKLPEPEYASV